MARQAHCLVRPASAADAKGLAHLENQVRAEGRWLCGDSLASEEDYLARALDAWSDGSAALVAELDGHLVGWLCLGRLTGAESHVAELEIWVALEARRRGVGSALFAEAFRWARTFDIWKLELGVLIDNLAARAMYEGLGFAEEGVLRSHCGRSDRPVDDVLMGLWLVDEPIVDPMRDELLSLSENEAPACARPARPEDFARLALISAPNTPSNLEDRIRASWTAEGVFLLAESGDNLAGVAVAKVFKERGRHVARAVVSLGSGWLPALHELVSTYRQWGEEFGLSKLEVRMETRFSDSAVAAQAVATAGFIEEARRRGHYRVENAFRDQVLFGRMLT